MNHRPELEQRDEAAELSLFCSPVGEVWRVHVRPSSWLPRYLKPYFDTHGEVYPALLDMEDLAQHMRNNDAPFEKRVTKVGGVELLAHGPAAESLAVWLSTAFASGVRPASR